MENTNELKKKKNLRKVKRGIRVLRGERGWEKEEKGPFWFFGFCWDWTAWRRDGLIFW
jgi:hypothetical protein